jgi:hypothetical protein
MNPITIIALLTGIPAAAGLALLAIVTAAIHAEERALSLPSAPATSARRLARRITRAYVSQPLAARAFAARHAAMPATAPPRNLVLNLRRPDHTITDAAPSPQPVP